ncbi:MarR family winged helix-turn-helix transcriptional regulator [Ihubacter sp. mB4P-1]|uniref:MarR family winged helix-turn-helix transcriptional regulator n=1 Tax=Ihubacter sp. mB4P-1 TaxID=3242370 RepID=UPI00137A9784
MMKKEQQEFFEIMHSLRKLNLSSMLPNITHGDFGILKVIQCCGRCEEKTRRVRVSEIVKETQLPPPAISRCLRGLEHRGYVQRAVDRNDRRNTFVEVTEEGEALIEKVDGVMNEFADAVFVNIGDETMQKLNRYLREFVDVSRAEIEKRKYKGEKGERE